MLRLKNGLLMARDRVFYELKFGYRVGQVSMILWRRNYFTSWESLVQPLSQSLSPKAPLKSVIWNQGEGGEVRGPLIFSAGLKRKFSGSMRGSSIWFPEGVKELLH